MVAGQEIGIRIDQTLTQDATGTLVMLELEAMDLQQARTEVSVQYVDHNMIQLDFKNPDDHRFLQAMAAKYPGVTALNHTIISRSDSRRPPCTSILSFHPRPLTGVTFPFVSFGMTSLVVNSALLALCINVTLQEPGDG